MNVLIVKPSSFGDVVHAFPAIAMLQKLVGEDLRLTWVVNDNLAMLPAMMPGVQRIVTFPRHSWRQPKQLRRFWRELRQEKYDLTVDFQGLLRSGIITYLSGAPRKAGFQQAREGARFFYNEKCRLEESCRHAVDKNIALVKMVCRELSQEKSVTPEHPQLLLPEEAKQNAVKLLPGKTTSDKLLAVAFSTRWPSKTWPKEFFAAVIRETSARVSGLQCWLLGGRDDSALGDELAGLVSDCQVVNLTGKTDVPTLAALLQQSGALLTNDSGPMHLAAAMSTPCVAMFGATDPVLTGPWGPPGQHEVIRSKCSQHPCFQRICPRGGDVCQQEIDPQQVAKALAKKLQAAANKI